MNIHFFLVPNINVLLVQQTEFKFHYHKIPVSILCSRYKKKNSPSHQIAVCGGSDIYIGFKSV